jgi:hypothetical protein
MKLRKLIYAKDGEVSDGGLGDLFEHISGGGGGSESDAPVQEELEQEFEEPNEDLDPRGGEDDGEVEEAEDDVDAGAEEADEDTPAVADPSLDVIARLEAQNAELMKLLQNTTKKEEAAPEPAPDLFTTDGFTKLTDALELDDAGSAALSAFMKQFGTSVAQAAVSDSVRRTPEVVASQVSQAETNRKLREDFYAEHPALEAVDGYVGQMSAAVQQNNPNLTMKELLAETAKQTYAALNIDPKAVAKAGRPGKRKPAFSKAPKSGRKSKGKKTKLESQFDAMMNLDA